MTNDHAAYRVVQSKTVRLCCLVFFLLFILLLSF